MKVTVNIDCTPEEARSFFYQMEGRARLRGRIDGARVDERGHAYSETFRTR